MALSLHWFMTFISFPMFLRYKLLRVGFKTGVSILFGSKKQLGIFLGVDVVGREWKEGETVRSSSKLAACCEHLCPFTPEGVPTQPE